MAGIHGESNGFHFILERTSRGRRGGKHGLITLAQYNKTILLIPRKMYHSPTQTIQNTYLFLSY